MKYLLKVAVVALSITPAFPALAGSGSPLYGSWALQDFTLTRAGHIQAFCEGAHGTLTYERTGYVSVAINCPANYPQPAPADVSGGMLFYAGTFQVVGDSVHHHIENSNRADLMGSTLIRRLERLTTRRLVLTGRLGASGDELFISWTKRP